MTAAPLFTELIVIGCETAIWILLLLLSIFSSTWLKFFNDFKFFIGLPTLAFIYVLGIIFDRICDYILFGYLEWHKRKKEISEHINKKISLKQAKEEWITVRLKIYSAPAQFINIYNYQRHRLRILRATTVNFILITFSTVIFLSKLKIINPKILIITMAIGLFISISAFFSWFRIMQSNTTTAYKTSLKITI